MASMQTAVAFLRQLDATLELIAAPSSSLTDSEITGIRQALAHAYTTLGVVLEERNLEIEGVTLVCKFGTNPLNSLFTFFHHRHQ